MARNVAVVIGIGKTEGFPDLPGATSGAAAFAAWAQTAKLEVKPFFGRDIGATELKDCIVRLVDDGNVSQLLLYFAGHGMANGIGDDYWVLSAGTRRSEEVVDLSGSLTTARASRIPHLVVFSDACRTAESFLKLASLQSGTTSLFPNKDPSTSPTVIDHFYATRPGEVSQEVRDASTGGSASFFTRVLLRALRGEGSIALPDGETGAKVIYARELEAYLQEHVPSEAEAARAKTQVPWPIIESSDPFYIAQTEPPALLDLTVLVQVPALIDATQATIRVLKINRRSLQAQKRPVWSGQGPSFTAKLPGYGLYGVEATLTDHVQDPEPPNPYIPLTKSQTAEVKLLPTRALAPHLGYGAVPLSQESEAGPVEAVVESYIVDGAGNRHSTAPRDGIYSVVSVDLLSGRSATEGQLVRAGQEPRSSRGLVPDPATTRRIQELAAFPSRGHFETRTGLTVVGSTVYRCYARDGHQGLFKEGSGWNLRYYPQSASAVLGLRGSRYAALALWEGFIGDVSVGPVGVDHLAYLPAPGGPWDAGYPLELQQAARGALAVAEEAARRGHFGVTIDQRRAVASTLRQFKHYDPVLGVLAALAYHENGDTERIADMVRYFRECGQPVPFDIAFLAGVTSPQAPEPDIFPKFPMLTRVWQFLGPDSELHPAVAAARRSLAPSLWTTVVGGTGRRLGQAIAKGDLF